MASPDSTELLERVRFAGKWERYHISLSELGLDTCLAAPAQYSSTPVTFVLDRATALHALKRVVLAHPALCVQFGGKHDKKPSFVRLPKIDLNDVLHYSTDTTTPVEDVVNAELQKPLLRSSTTPLWRVTVRADNVVIFAWHHSIGDGGCAHTFHAAFLSALNTKSEGQDTDVSAVVLVPNKLTIAPPIEELTDTSVPLKTTLGALYDAFAPLAWKRLGKAWTASPVPKERDLRIETRIRRIDPDDVCSLVSLCREKKCTLTAFMHTLSTLVLSHHLAQSEKEAFRKKKYKTFSTVVPISLRRFTGISALDIRDHVSIYHSYPPIVRDIPVYPPTKDSFPWQTAAEYATTLHANLGKARQVIGLVGYIHGLVGASKYFHGHLGKKRDYTLVLSNIGAMPKLRDLGDKQRDDGVLWQVEDIGFGQNDNVIGSAIKVGMTGSPSGAVSAAYNWGSNNIDSRFVEAFIEDVHASISSILAV